MYAGISHVQGDEGAGARLRDDMEVIGATGVEEVDGGRGPMTEDDGPTFLSHGDVLGVVVPVIAEGIDLSLKVVGDGKDEGVFGGQVVVLGSEECVCLSFEEILDLAPDEKSDGCIDGHCVLGRK